MVGVGDGEETILELLDHIEGRAFAGIPGVCYLRDGVPVRTTPSHDIRDLDRLPLPARHLLPVADLVMSDRLAGTDLRMAHTMFSRGCPFKCRFCAVAGSAIYYRSGASARHELEHLIGVYGVDGFAVVDDNFIINRHKVTDI